MERNAVHNSGTWAPRALFTAELSKLIEIATACAGTILDNGQDEYLNGLRDLVYVIYQINNRLWSFDDWVDSECGSNAESLNKLLEDLTDAIRKDEEQYEKAQDEARLEQMMKNLPK